VKIRVDYKYLSVQTMEKKGAKNMRILPRNTTSFAYKCKYKNIKKKGQIHNYISQLKFLSNMKINITILILE
jgi:hypothetical protein